MKKFIVNREPYMFEDGDIGEMQAPSLSRLIWMLFGRGVTIPQAEEANGDGMQYISIFDLQKKKKVFG